MSDPRRLANFSKEKGKEYHHTLTDQDELTELFTFHKSLVLFCDRIENFPKSELKTKFETMLQLASFNSGGWF